MAFRFTPGGVFEKKYNAKYGYRPQDGGTTEGPMPGPEGCREALAHNVSKTTEKLEKQKYMNGLSISFSFEKIVSN
jgi:hypothetical protein